MSGFANVCRGRSPSKTVAGSEKGVIGLGTFVARYRKIDSCKIVIRKRMANFPK